MTPTEEPNPDLPTQAAERANSHFDALREIVQRAQAGDVEAILPLREFLRAGRSTTMMLGGDVGWEAIRRAVRNYSGKDLAMREAVHQQIEYIRQELVGNKPYPGGVERLLIDRVLSTWLHLSCLEMNYAEQDRPSIESDSYFERAISAAQKRYLAVLRQFAEQTKRRGRSNQPRHRASQRGNGSAARRGERAR